MRRKRLHHDRNDSKFNLACYEGANTRLKERKIADVKERFETTTARKPSNRNFGRLALIKQTWRWFSKI